MLDDYDKQWFQAELTGGRLTAHDVYVRGEGPVVVIMQELPGIGRETLRLADMFVDHGYRVVLPHLFGPLGRTSMLGNMARIFCMRREFHLFAKNGSSPIVGWLRALCRHHKHRSGRDGVAVIGMCLTGNFALSLMADEAVLASVASQPALPLLAQGALHMSQDEMAATRRRLDDLKEATEPPFGNGQMLALRFEKDPLCAARKFEAIDHGLNRQGHRVRQRVLPGKGHSVLTLDFVNEKGHPTREAFDDVVSYFDRAFKIERPPTTGP